MDRKLMLAALMSPNTHEPHVVREAIREVVALGDKATVREVIALMQNRGVYRVELYNNEQYGGIAAAAQTLPAGGQRKGFEGIRDMLDAVSKANPGIPPPPDQVGSNGSVTVG